MTHIAIEMLAQRIIDPDITPCLTHHERNLIAEALRDESKLRKLVKTHSEVVEQLIVEKETNINLCLTLDETRAQLVTLRNATVDQPIHATLGLELATNTAISRAHHALKQARGET